MEHSTLEDLLDALEKDRNVHICIGFQEDYENSLLELSGGHRYHNAPICKSIRKKYGGYQPCFRCRRIVERMVTKYRKPVAGCCRYGVYEYCHPVIYQEKVVAIVYVGNILMNTEEQNARISKVPGQRLLPTMDSEYSYEDCRRTANIVASYVTLLLDTYGISKAGQDPLVEKVKRYIFENYTFGFSASDIAETFGYNEKYLGRIFKEKAGQSIKEYCNTLRVNEAKKLLTSTALPISEIAGLTGFNNITYFNYVFGKHTGMAPTQYREAAAKTFR